MSDKVNSLSIGIIKGLMVGLEYDEDPDGAYEFAVCLDLFFIRITYLKGIDLDVVNSL